MVKPRQRVSGYFRIPSTPAAQTSGFKVAKVVRAAQNLRRLLFREDKNMAVRWNKDADAALAEAKAAKRPLLVDFSAAPA